jgi:spermidine synthase
MTRDQQLVFETDYIVLKDQPNRFVMMSWETDLMKQHALRVTQNRGNILEIGFGMGISAQFIQDFGCDSHTIIESHPEILEKLYKWAKDKSNVTIIPGDWFELQDIICKNRYDGIFYDADCNNSPVFRHAIVDKVLNKNGIFTYFAPNGTDKYRYGNKLYQDIVEIKTHMPKNAYHNDNTCMCPYFINIKQ